MPRDIRQFKPIEGKVVKRETGVVVVECEELDPSSALAEVAAGVQLKNSDKTKGILFR